MILQWLCKSDENRSRCERIANDFRGYVKVTRIDRVVNKIDRKREKGKF